MMGKVKKMADQREQEHWVADADRRIKEVLTTVRSVWRPETLVDLFREIELVAHLTAEKFLEANSLEEL